MESLLAQQHNQTKSSLALTLSAVDTEQQKQVKINK